LGVTGRGVVSFMGSWGGCCATVPKHVRGAGWPRPVVVRVAMVFELLFVCTVKRVYYFFSFVYVTGRHYLPLKMS
jgi:hypothetical protein